jgi:hypothetical protein
MRTITFLLAAMLAAPVAAQQGTSEKLERMPDIPPPPPAPDVIKSDDVNRAAEEELEPSVTIKTEGEKKIEEYRIRGRLYMVKVINKGAPPYYLIDRDGDGLFESRRSELNPRIFVPLWAITQW